MTLQKRLITAFVGIMFVVALGVAGFCVIEGWSFLDSLYMTVITLTTVGYDEVNELSAGGRVFCIVLMVSGVGVMLYALTLVGGFIIEGHLGGAWERHRMRDQLKKLDNHFIVCGYGRVGKEISAIFQEKGETFLVVDCSEDAIELAKSNNCLYLHGNITNDEILRMAGIERAQALIAAVGNDSDNVYITLSAREMRPDIFIAARASAEEAERKLRRAGADRVISPARLGGRRMAMLSLHPLALDFIDMALNSSELSLEDVEITVNSTVVGMTIQEAQASCEGVTILAVRKQSGDLLARPSTDIVLEAGDDVVAIGSEKQLSSLGSRKTSPLAQV